MRAASFPALVVAASTAIACFARAQQPTVPAAPEAQEWRRAEGRREWVFPGDHGAHPEYRTEWWYFTGVLRGGEGVYGYQLTFFRQGLAFTAADPGNPWSVRDLYFAHFALTDLAAGSFASAERASRRGPGLAEAVVGDLGVRVLGWSARRDGDAIVLEARDGPRSIALRLRQETPPVLHGEGGLSRKGAGAGEASWYCSVPDLSTEGAIDAGRGPVRVRGSTWFDHEFGSGQLPAGAAGWDWFGLRLSDGRALMLFLLRGGGDATAGTVAGAHGDARALGGGEFTVEVIGRWTSPRSGATYPSRWRVRVPAEGIDLDVVPALADQELATPRSTGITYWEGLVTARGASGGAPVSAEGYVELTGYAGRIGGTF